MKRARDSDDDGDEEWVEEGPLANLFAEMWNEIGQFCTVEGAGNIGLVSQTWYMVVSYFFFFFFGGSFSGFLSKSNSSAGGGSTSSTPNCLRYF